MSEERARQAALLREVFRSPTEETTLSQQFRTSDVLRLAQVAYGQRISASGQLDQANLLMLSDALEEAGYPDDAVLTHLRSPGPHVRGCWAVDLVLGKE